MSESIEANVRDFPEESHVHGVTQTIPGENGARGSGARWAKPRRGELSGESESIEASVRYFPKESDVHWITQTVPGGNRTHI